MTRKRFVKLYMATGLPRNSAIWLAKIAIKTVGSYWKFADLSFGRKATGRHGIKRIHGRELYDAEWTRHDLSRWHISSDPEMCQMPVRSQYSEPGHTLHH